MVIENRRYARKNVPKLNREKLPNIMSIIQEDTNAHIHIYEHILPSEIHIYKMEIIIQLHT